MSKHQDNLLKHYGRCWTKDRGVIMRLWDQGHLTDAMLLDLAQRYRCNDSIYMSRLVVSLCVEILKARNTSSSLEALKQIEEEMLV